jgi:hypothetical protein
MKKKSGKAQSLRSAQEKAEHRNVQMPRLRKGSVHPVPDQPTEPTEPTNPTPVTRARRKRHRLKLQPGQPSGKSKLTLALSKKLCALIRQQATLEDAAAKCGVCRDRVWEWRTRGQQGEHPAYVAFERAITEALIDAKQKLVAGIAEDRDIRGKLFLLKNRYPKEYRDRIVQEMSGPDGSPLAVGGEAFTVLIELAGPQPDEREFTIVHQGGPLDGKREIWQPGVI